MTSQLRINASESERETSLFPDVRYMPAECAESPLNSSGSSDSTQDPHYLVKKLESPKDRYNTVLLVFTLFGIAGVAPWNFFVTPSSYWMYKLRDVNSSKAQYTGEHKSELQATFTSYLAISSMVPNTLMFIASTYLNKKISRHIRIVGPLSLILVLFIVTTGLVLTDTDEWQTTFLGVTLLIVVLMNASVSIFQASVFGIAGVFSASYMQAMMNGQAVSGIIASLIQLGTLAVIEDPIKGALLYFCLGILIIAFCLLCYPCLTRQIFYKYHISHVEDSLNYISDSNQHTEVPLQIIMRRIRGLAFTVVVCFITTLAVYPSVAVLILSVNRASGSVWTNKYFTTTVCFLLFNCGDFCGRAVAQWISFTPPKVWIMPLLSILRLVFIPLMLLSNAHPRHYLPVIFNSDVSFIVIITTFAVSNGYLLTLSMMLAPKQVLLQHREKAAMLMALFMSIGISMGALLSPLFVKIL